MTTRNILFVTFIHTYQLLLYIVSAHSPTFPSLHIYVTTHSPTLSLRYLRHSSFCHPSVASPTSQCILQPFFRFSYVTSSSLNSPGELPMYLYAFSFSNSGTSLDRTENNLIIIDKTLRISLESRFLGFKHYVPQTVMMTDYFWYCNEFELR